MSSTTMTSDHFVFMYGTLKAREPNHHHMYDADPNGVRFVRQAITDDRFPVIIATENNIPFLLFHDGTAGNQIVGEVYEVNDTTMKMLDKFESYPIIYDRKLVNVTVTPNDAEEPYKLKCWIYGLSRFKASFLELPQYSEYLSAGDHNRPFKPFTKDTSLEDVKSILFDDKD